MLVRTEKKYLLTSPVLNYLGCILKQPVVTASIPARTLTQFSMTNGDIALITASIR